MQVLVRDNNVDQALKALKKKMQREGIFREMKLRGHYEKPSERRVRERAEAIRRARKLARKRAQREGLIPQKSPAMLAKEKLAKGPWRPRRGHGRRHGNGNGRWWRHGPPLILLSAWFRRGQTSCPRFRFCDPLDAAQPSPYAPGMGKP